MPKSLREKREANTKTHAFVKAGIGGREAFFGPGPAGLFKQIEVSGNVRQAAQDMQISYSKAWKIISHAEKECNRKLVERSHGGKDGGKASLTNDGREFMRLYSLYNEEIKAKADECFEKYFADFFKGCNADDDNEGEE